MDEHFHSVWETAVDWNSDDQSKGYDGDGLTNEEEWKYRTDPFLTDTDGDTLADKLETEATFTNPLSKTPMETVSPIISSLIFRDLIHWLTTLPRPFPNSLLNQGRKP